MHGIEAKPEPTIGELLEACQRSEEHTSELQSLRHLVCRLLLEKKKKRLYRSLVSEACRDCATHMSLRRAFSRTRRTATACNACFGCDRSYMTGPSSSVQPVCEL